MGSFMGMEQMERHTRIQRIFQDKNSTRARRAELQRISEVVNSFGRHHMPIPKGINPNTSVQHNAYHQLVARATEEKMMIQGETFDPWTDPAYLLLEQLIEEHYPGGLPPPEKFWFSDDEIFAMLGRRPLPPERNAEAPYSAEELFFADNHVHIDSEDLSGQNEKVRADAIAARTETTSKSLGSKLVGTADELNFATSGNEPQTEWPLQEAAPAKRFFTDAEYWEKRLGNESEAALQELDPAENFFGVDEEEQRSGIGKLVNDSPETSTIALTSKEHESRNSSIGPMQPSALPQIPYGRKYSAILTPVLPPVYQTAYTSVNSQPQVPLPPSAFNAAIPAMSGASRKLKRLGNRNFSSTQRVKSEWHKSKMKDNGEDYLKKTEVDYFPAFLQHMSRPSLAKGLNFKAKSNIIEALSFHDRQMLKSFLEKTLDNEETSRRASKNGIGTAKAPISIDDHEDDHDHDDGDHDEGDSVTLVKNFGSAPNFKHKPVQSKKRVYENYSRDDNQMRMGVHVAPSKKRSRTEGAGMMGMQNCDRPGVRVQQNPPKSFPSFDNIGTFQAKAEYQPHQSMDMGLGISGLGMPHDTQQTAFADHPYQPNNSSICGNGVHGGIEVADQQSSSAGMGGAAGAGLDYFGLPLGNDNDSMAFRGHQYQPANSKQAGKGGYGSVGVFDEFPLEKPAW